MHLRSSFTSAWTRGAALALGLAAGLVPLTGLHAQRGNETVYVVKSGDPAQPDLDVRTLQPRGFQLFSSSDAAFAGLRMTGNYATMMTNYGDCSSVLRGCQRHRVFNFTENNSRAPFFHLEWVYGTPASEWIKIRNVAPSAANATGGGYLGNAGNMFISRPVVFGPKDGTLGALFSGATSTTDGSCRDHTGFANAGEDNPSGLQLLPGSDCAETWGTLGWMGAHPIDLAGYKALFDQQGAAFAFDYWRVPPEFQRLDKMFLGTGFHTYGQASDYNVDLLPQYGGVVPGGAGAPTKPGYPLGLDIHFEAFNFAVPTVNGAKFVQQLVVNNSEALWGTAIDYDSLYFGLSHGTLFQSQGISMYALPEKGLVMFHENNAKGAGGPCSQSFRTTPVGCGNAATAANRGYGRGAIGVIVLKSPLGDLRNKLFTRTSSGAPCAVGVDPFCTPTHPLAGDTITFNQNRNGGFGSADAATFGFSARAAFGHISATPANTLDGRTPADLPAGGYTVFRNIGFPAIAGVYSKYVPGVGGGPGSEWDWNHDGQPDTLALEACGPQGCVSVSSDTLPNGLINFGGNIGGVIGTGPLALAAGDTMTWTYAVVGDGDSTRFWTQVDAAIDLYLNFYLAPESPPPAAVVSTQLTPASDQFGTADPQVQIFFGDAHERWIDPFLSKAADDIEAAPAGTPLGEIRLQNPGLVAAVRARAADNVEALEIYKSCDGGASFTADNACDGEPATDEFGNSAGFGWQAYARFLKDDSPGGDLPNAFTDNNVDGGKSYLYVLVAKSRGAKFLVNDTIAGADSLILAPSIRNVLSRSTSDVNVVSVYVPASRQAGSVPATSVLTQTPRDATVPANIELSDRAVAGSYQAVFGNRLLVRRDSSISAGNPTGSAITVLRHEMVDAGGIAVDSVIRATTYTYARTEVFPVSGTGSVGAPVPNGDIVSTTTTFNALGFVISGANGPIFGGTTLTGAAATPTDLFARPDYPGFLVDLDNSLGGTFNTAGETQYRGATSIGEQGLLPSDTVVPRGVVNGFMAQWRENAAVRTADGGGRYEVTWTADPFGTVRGFAMNLNTPTATEAEVRAALLSRPAGATGLTDAATATLLGVDQSLLVPVRIPFTVRNVTFDRPVQLAMQARVNNRLRLGFGTDTISVEVQADEWMPGDPLFFIEDVEEEQRSGIGLVLDGAGQPQPTTRRAVTFTAAVLGCNPGTTVLTERCNPIQQGDAGAAGYNPMREGDRTAFEYYLPVRATSQYAFDIVAPVSGAAITAVTDSAVNMVRVVPNPFIVFSEYQVGLGNSQLLFAGVPPRGTLRIYTVSGQFVQQITWTPDDLLGDGDLFWNLQTREGIDIASGLYLWVLTAPSDPTNASSTPVQGRGKFVVIRGNERGG